MPPQLRSPPTLRPDVRLRAAGASLLSSIILDYHQGDGGDSFGTTLARPGRYERLTRETLRRKGLPEDLVYLSLIESGFKPLAYSLAAAAGLCSSYRPRRGPVFPSRRSWR